MQVLNPKLRKTIPFEEYLQMPGVSYSGLKSEGRAFTAPTAKMHFGTLVHTYLLKPREYDHGNEHHHLVKPVAATIKALLGPLLPIMQPEAIATADFVHEGFALPYKGQIDLCIPGRLVVDLKVTEMPLQRGIEHFGYDNQVTGYCLSIGATKGIIVGIHPKTHATTIKQINLNPAWWEYHVKRKGAPML